MSKPSASLEQQVKMAIRPLTILGLPEGKSHGAVQSRSSSIDILGFAITFPVVSEMLTYFHSIASVQCTHVPEVSTAFIPAMYCIDSCKP